MAINLNAPRLDSGQPLTAADLTAWQMPRRRLLPAGCDSQGRHQTREWRGFENPRRFPTIGLHLIDEKTPAYSDTVPTDAAPLSDSVCAYGGDEMKPIKHQTVIPLSRIARLWLALRRWLMG